MLTYDDILEVVVSRMREATIKDVESTLTLGLTEIVMSAVPDSKTSLGQVYATSADYLDQVNEDGGKVSELIRHNLQVMLLHDALKRRREIESPQQYSDNVVKGIFGGDPWKT